MDETDDETVKPLVASGGACAPLYGEGIRFDFFAVRTTHAPPDRARPLPTSL